MSAAMPGPPFEAVSEQTEIPPDQRTLVVLCHLSSLAAYVLPVLGSVIGPLVFWLVKKDESPHVDLAGRNCLNFALTLLLVAIVSGILVLVGIGICVLLVLPILHVIPVIIAAVKAADGKHWHYPATIRFL